MSVVSARRLGIGVGSVRDGLPVLESAASSTPGSFPVKTLVFSSRSSKLGLFRRAASALACSGVKNDRWIVISSSRRDRVEEGAGSDALDAIATSLSAGDETNRSAFGEVLASSLVLAGATGSPPIPAYVARSEVSSDAIFERPFPSPDGAPRSRGVSSMGRGFDRPSAVSRRRADDPTAAGPPRRSATRAASTTAGDLLGVAGALPGCGPDSGRLGGVRIGGGGGADRPEGGTADVCCGNGGATEVFGVSGGLGAICAGVGVRGVTGGGGGGGALLCTAPGGMTDRRGGGPGGLREAGGCWLAPLLCVGF